jgi:predicted amidohydrolase
MDYDLLFYVANFPAKRSYPWKQLLIARAIENQAYTIGVNRVGHDGIGIDYTGDSMIIDYKGEILLETQEFNQWISHTISKNPMLSFRRAYPFLRDQDL